MLGPGITPRLIKIRDPYPSTLADQYYLIDENGKALAFNVEDVESLQELKERKDYYGYFLSEELKSTAHATPPHIAALTKLQLASLEPASDVGNFRYYPFGALLKGLLEDYVREIALHDLGSYEIETPLLYDYSLPDIHEQAKEFRQKDYHLRVGNRHFLLRFASDFGLFRMMKDASVREEALPVRMYEISKSFRLERRSECVGMRRLRAFTMPDIHSFCSGMEQGEAEFAFLTKKYDELLRRLGLPYVLVARVIKSFLSEGLDYLSHLATEMEKAILVDVIPTSKYYWVMKDEFQVLDSTGNNLQLSTVQLDVKNGERYGLTYAKRDGSRGTFIIVHSSLGTIERLISSLIEEAYRKGGLPMLPTWLSPVQVRVVPVSFENEKAALEVCQKIRDAGFRAYVDDSDSSFNKKVRDAQMHWTPYVVVVGKKEEQEGALSVTIRSLSSLESSHVERMSVDGLISRLEMETAGFPKRSALGPARLTLLPKF